MNAIGIACIVLACVAGAALFGALLQSYLPAHHVSADSKDAVKLGAGVIATLAALVLSLLIASTKSAYDTKNTEIKQMSASVLLLDRILAHYGPDAKDARDELRSTIVLVLDRIWPARDSRPPDLAPAGGVEAVFDKIHGLAPQNDVQRSIQAEALQISIELAKTRFLLFEQAGTSIRVPFLVVLVFWLMVLFGAFGLLAPRNATVLAALFVCALSVSGAVFLLLELDQPFQGLMQISSAPLRDVLARLGE